MMSESSVEHDDSEWCEGCVKVDTYQTDQIHKVPEERLSIIQVIIPHCVRQPGSP